MSTLNRKGIIYHKKLKALLLKKTDHALIFRLNKAGEVDVVVHLGCEKSGEVTHGGLLVGTIGMNIFDSEFIDKIINQIDVVSKLGTDP